ncbi:MAG TPA: ABC transporter ATP-binding protein [Chloroflexia bacterium]|nr:ABC transporter ATP-binding protein [Chloroflexia bacterium]
MALTSTLNTRQQGALLATYLRPQRGKVATLAVLLAANMALQLASPLILRTFIDAAIAQRPLETLIGAAVLFLAVALATQGVSVAETYMAEDVGWTATNRLRTDLTRHLLALDMRFHNGRTPGELIERVDGDITALANFFSRFVMLILGNAVLMVGVLVMLFREDWRVGLAMSVFALVAVVLMTASSKIGVAAAGGERQAYAELFGFVEERLAGLPDIRANGAVAYVMRRLHGHNRALFDAGRYAALRESFMMVINVALFTVGYVLALSLGALLFNAGAITLGTVYLFFAYADMLRRPLDQITKQLQDLQKAAASTIRIQELYAARTTIKEGAVAALPQGPLAVELAGVRFGYGDEEPVLSDVSFRLAPGRVLGVVGRTGSGKTTLSRLLLRLYDPEAGTVRLGEIDIRLLTLGALRSAVGVVTQDVQLFQATLRDNLALFDPRLGDARILAVIDELGLGPWYATLPEGLDTELEAGGGGISAGQAQLLAFARVFLRDPGLVILDEASSRLDPATERLIERAVDRLLQGRTAIIIAHRLRTLDRADEILVLDEGRVVEHGPRSLLAADPAAHFFGLLQTGLEEILR